jgi:hypothetical protein
MKISLQSLITVVGLQNQHDREIYPPIENFTRSMKKYTFGNQTGGKAFRAQKRNLGAKISMVV